MCKNYLVVIQREENNYRLRGRKVEKWELIIKNFKKVCLKCLRYSERFEFGKCMTTRKDMLKCVYKKMYGKGELGYAWN